MSCESVAILSLIENIRESPQGADEMNKWKLTVFFKQNGLVVSDFDSNIFVS